MPKSIDITCSIDADGKIPRSISEQIKAQFVLRSGKDVRIIISDRKRSSKANRFYWVGIIRPIQLAMAEAGRAVSAEVLHEYFKQLYLTPESGNVFDTDLVLPISTTRLDQQAFHTYIESIKTDENILVLGVIFDEPEGVFTTHSIDDLPY